MSIKKPTNKDLMKDEFLDELNAILCYWQKYTVDFRNGGFYGRINFNNEIEETADKGIVLNARILWAFSAGYILVGSKEYLKLAKRSYDYITAHFFDTNHGGVFWSVDFEGKPKNTKKQIYALAFTIYGLTEYYKASKDENALLKAKQIFEVIEKHSFDVINGGYIEALSEEWQVLKDLRLSDKDANEKKTMNTHLHIIEAYSNLYAVWPNQYLKIQILGLLKTFDKYIIDHKSKRMILFFDENWTAKSDIISYGHDIEASWLLLEAAEIIDDEKLIVHFKKIAIEMANAAGKGIAANGGVIYEYEPKHNIYNYEKHWWVQAEAMVGFLNAFQLSKQEVYYNYFLNIWKFTKEYIIDHKNGEWFWGVDNDNEVMSKEDKAGFWKCPYHNSRACIEMVKRLSKV